MRNLTAADGHVEVELFEPLVPCLLLSEAHRSSATSTTTMPSPRRYAVERRRSRRNGDGGKARPSNRASAAFLRREACEIAQGLEALERLPLELAHPLASQVELVPDGLERPRLAFEAEPELENPPLRSGRASSARRML